MPDRLNRKDFLKLLALVPPALYLTPKFAPLAAAPTRETPNILVLVFDAWSAKNMSLYGYPRKTTPYLEKLAEKAIVYHNHYAGGHYTVPGTASLLTGALSWLNGKYTQNHALDVFFHQNNIFGVVPDYYRLAYTHNPWATEVLKDMVSAMDFLKPEEDLYLTQDYFAQLFRGDYDTASVSWIQTMEIGERGFANSAFFSRLWTTYTNRKQQALNEEFPRGLPRYSASNTFLLEDAIDWLEKHLNTPPFPALTYFHLLPPHNPPNTRKEFVNAFASDGYSPPKKPQSFLTDGVSNADNLLKRTAYDEFILYVDAELQRFFSLLEKSSQANNTWVILTSDHGEIFERGLIAHKKPSMYEPLVHVPLMIFPPGQQERIDVHAPTSATDILPTLLSIAGKDTPDWSEGMVLPPFNTDYPADRPVYMVDAKQAEVGQPYHSASLMLRKDNYKLIYHFGTAAIYKPLNGVPYTELYDISADPEELENLYSPDNPIGAAMLEEINHKLISMGLLT